MHHPPSCTSSRHPAGIHDGARADGRPQRADGHQEFRRFAREGDAAADDSVPADKHRCVLRGQQPGAHRVERDLHPAGRHRPYQERDKDPGGNLLRRHRGLRAPHRDPGRQRHDARGDGLRPHFRQGQHLPFAGRFRHDEDEQEQGLSHLHPLPRHELSGEQHPQVEGYHARTPAHRFRQAGAHHTSQELQFPEVRQQPLRRPGEGHAPQAAEGAEGFARDQGQDGQGEPLHPAHAVRQFPPEGSAGYRKGRWPGAVPFILRERELSQVEERLPEEEGLREGRRQCRQDADQPAGLRQRGLRILLLSAPHEHRVAEEVRPGSRLSASLLYRRSAGGLRAQGFSRGERHHRSAVFRALLGGGHHRHEAREGRSRGCPAWGVHLRPGPGPHRCISHFAGHQGRDSFQQ